MKFAQSISQKIVFMLIPLFFTMGCAQFQGVDRELVNKPSMSLGSSPFIKGKTSLTNQKSSSTSSVGACTVCAH